MSAFGIFISFGVAILEWFGDRDPAVVFGYAVLAPVLLLVPRAVNAFVPGWKERAGDEWVGKMEFYMSCMVLMHAPGSLYFHKVGLQYDRALHVVGGFFQTMIVALTVAPLVRGRDEAGRRRAELLTIVIAAVNLLLWELIQWSTDRFAGTHLFFDPLQPIARDFAEDILFGAIGVAAAWAAFSKRGWKLFTDYAAFVETKLHSTVVNRLVVIAAVFGVLVVLWRATGLHDLFFSFLAFLETAARESGPAGAFAFYGLCTLASAIGPFTVVPIVPAVVRVWGLPLTGALLMLGGLSGGALTYLIGRFAGDRVLRLFVRPGRLEVWKAHIPERTAFLLALAIKFALPAEVGYAFGAIRFGFLRYMLVTFISYVPIVAAILWGSRAFVEGRFLPVVLSLAAIAALSIAAGIYLRRMQKGKTS